MIMIQPVFNILPIMANVIKSIYDNNECLIDFTYYLNIDQDGYMYIDITTCVDGTPSESVIQFNPYYEINSDDDLLNLKNLIIDRINSNQHTGGE